MRRASKGLFFTIEINLLLWLAAGGIVLASDQEIPGLKGTIVLGMIFAAIFQHWAYYAVYKRTTKTETA